MKHILFLLLFLPVLAYAQFPANPNKIRLGNQTTADGLVVRTAAAPSWTPSTVNNAWLAFDTVAAVLYYYDAATWNTFSSGAGGNVTGVSLSNDTLFITTPDSTFSQLLRNFANSNLTFTGNRVHNLSTRTLTIADGGTYPTFQQSAATDGITIASSATDLIAQTPGLLQIENSDTITITADRIRMNAADTRIQQIANDNALNRLAAIDSLTGRLYYVDKSSISSGGTVTGSGTTGTIPVWSSSTALGDSPLTVSSGSVIAGGTGFFRIPVGTTAQRPGAPTAGDARYSSTNGTLEYYGASAWEVPVRGASATGLGSPYYMPIHDVNGRIASATDYYYLSGLFGTGAYSNGRFAIDPIAGQTRIARIGQLEIVTNGAPVWTGQGFSVPGPNRAFEHIYSPGNSTDAFVWKLRPPSIVASTPTFNRAGGNVSLVIMELGQVGPSGSTARYEGLRLNNHVNGESTQPYRALSIVRTGTGTQEYRSIEAPTGINVLGGSLKIGDTLAPLRTLHVTGEARITDLTTDTPTQIVGADADGDLGAITVGSGLSLTSGTLAATGGAGTVTSVGITAPAAGITVSGSPVTSSGSMTLALADDLAAVEGLSANGIATRTASNTWAARTITGGSGIAITNGDGVSGNPTISRTYSLTHITISGGSTFFSTTPERPDNDTPGTQTSTAIGSDFGVSGSTLDYTGASGALLRVEGSVSFSVADDGDYYISIFKEGTEIAATSTRISCVAGNYYTIGLPATTTSGATNDTFDVRIATGTGTSTTTMHRYGFIIERVY